MLDRIFGLRKNGTNIKTEIMAGITTFIAMSYIIFVNPSFLSQTGMDFTAVMIGTCIAAAVGTLLTAFMLMCLLHRHLGWANAFLPLPFALVWGIVGNKHSQ